MPPEATINLAFVDDSLPLRKLLGTYLLSKGFNIILEASNGQEFLDKLEVATILPDICLLDTNMPVMDGYETAGRLKEAYPSILIMGYSFHDDQESEEKFLLCGAHDFICKDAPANEVRDALIALFNKNTKRLPP